ncbi:MAG: hypothetical protein KZQ70_12955 [gamma proteobacterium symbiont of Lucinoma myriamae]|nr:hypothetical protein [gamma proteobacterium symbiont of Lucinoma myriamae]
MVKRRAKKEYENQKQNYIHNLASTNPRLFWTEIKRLKGGTSKLTSITADDFFEHFKDIYCDSEKFNVNYVEEIINQMNTDDNFNVQINIATEALDAVITVQDVYKAITKLKRNKSPGIDLLPPELFLDSSDLICPLLAKLFNHLFDNHLYPESWTKGIIVPVPKKGNRSNVNNYRGITLTSIFSKNYSHILDDRLRNWCEGNNLMSDCQFGFRAQKSTVDCVYFDCYCKEIFK